MSAQLAAAQVRNALSIRQAQAGLSSNFTLERYREAGAALSGAAVIFEGVPVTSQTMLAGEKSTMLAL